MASQADLRNGVRSVMDGAHSIALKKSMKFANSYGTNGPDAATVDDDGKGTIRSGMGTGRGTGHHHHANRWGRNAGNGHASLFDNESPFQTATKSSKFSSRDPRQSSRPTSPRVANMKMSHGTSKKNSPISTGYEPDEGADDERTPLMGSARSIRSTRARRTGSSMRQLYQARRDQSLISRFGGCLVLMLMFVLVIAGGTVFLFSTSQPLTDVKILALKNILASEQDVIVDMKVSARNPNLVAVTVESMDMVAFAKSKYAGTDEEWWKGPPSDDFDGWIALGRTRSSRHSRRRTSTLSDPSLLYPAPHSDPDSTDPASPNLEIGHVYTFESPLIFEGSPFSTTHSLSLGELRIDKPGNATEPRGSERWGRVLQHEFELIIRGTLKYSLPLSQRIRSVSVEGRVTVQGNEAGHGPQDNGDGHGDELETNLHTRD